MRFRVRFRGYDRAQVDQRVSALEGSIGTLTEEKERLAASLQELRNENTRMQERVDGLVAREQMVGRMLIEAEEESVHRLAACEQHVNRLLMEAQEESARRRAAASMEEQRILAEAQEEAQRLMKEARALDGRLRETRQEATQFLQQILDRLQGDGPQPLQQVGR